MSLSSFVVWIDDVRFKRLSGKCECSPDGLFRDVRVRRENLLDTPPAASFSRINSTVILVPLTTGFPIMTEGSEVIKPLGIAKPLQQD